MNEKTFLIADYMYFKCVNRILYTHYISTKKMGNNYYYSKYNYYICNNFKSNDKIWILKSETHS